MQTPLMQQKKKDHDDLFEHQTVQRQENKTGLPDNLKAGIENLSGHSMDDVKVHYNSPKPAQLQAHAFAQGTDIHIAPGQQKHLPHEAWHVAQQKQGRVKATAQLKGIGVNDSPALEREADVIGQKALNFKGEAAVTTKNTMLKGSSSPIQGWWPKGHRLISRLAFEESGFSDKFSEKARNYLIKRSPDIDFIQDVYDTMNAGISQTKPYLKLYQDYIENGQLEQAKNMYLNGELNYRRPEYLLMHGEAGGYRSSGNGAKNAAVTNMFVQKAINQWQSGNKANALSTLSDALHQSSDRGSHGEGDAFKGHDVRIQLGVKGEGDIPGIGAQKWEQQEWEQPLGGKLNGAAWAPDNFAVNTKGAALGVRFAIGALSKFINGIGLEENEKVTVDKVNDGRKLKAKKALPASKSKSFFGRSVGKTGDTVLGNAGEVLKKIYDKALEKEDDQEELQSALEEPLNQAPEEFQELLARSEQFYTTGLTKGKIYNDAKRKFKDLKKNKAGIEEYKNYYNTEKNGKDEVLFYKHVSKAYKEVMNKEITKELRIKAPKNKTISDIRVKIFREAETKFTQWKKPLRKGGLSEEKRIEEAKKHIIAAELKATLANQDEERKTMIKDTIRAAYKKVYGEELL